MRKARLQGSKSFEWLKHMKRLRTASFRKSGEVRRRPERLLYPRTFRVSCNQGREQATSREASGIIYIDTQYDLKKFLSALSVEVILI